MEINRYLSHIAIVGPTAVGKTAIGILLAKSMDAEIVSADSVQVYRMLDIGAAKPTPEEQSQAKFHLIDIVDPDEEWTLADMQNASAAAHDEILSRGKIPLIVGGTGLYIRALTTRLDIPVAPPNEELRERWRILAEEHGNEYIYNELVRIDPNSAAKIHVNDVKRIIRAIEVYEQLGVPMSVLHERNQALADEEKSLIIALNYADRRKLYTRIEERADQMMAGGFVEEVRGLLEAGYSPELKSMQSLGYRQLSAYLNGQIDLPTAVDEIKRDTRHFARRQLIWFRGDKRVQWLHVDGKSPDDIAGEAAALINADARVQ